MKVWCAEDTILKYFNNNSLIRLLGSIFLSIVVQINIKSNQISFYLILGHSNTPRATSAGVHDNALPSRFLLGTRRHQAPIEITRSFFLLQQSTINIL